jgi:ribosome-associated translation inhibitor RaiA
MQTRIVFRGMDASDALSSLIARKARTLSRFYGHIETCRVAVEEAHGQFEVAVELHVPGADLVDRGVHTDPYKAVRIAFHAAKRLVEDYIGKRRDLRRSSEPAAPPAAR